MQREDFFAKPGDVLTADEQLTEVVGRLQVLRPVPGAHVTTARPLFVCERFGFVGALSPALWFADAQLFEHLDACDYVDGRVYLDIGLDEGAEHVNHVHALHMRLLAKGYRQGQDLFYVEEPEAGHDESAWARRLRTALYFLLPSS
jgi:predicted alpha/beta superfamily hydrolase